MIIIIIIVIISPSNNFSTPAHIRSGIHYSAVPAASCTLAELYVNVIGHSAGELRGHIVHATNVTSFADFFIVVSLFRHVKHLYNVAWTKGERIRISPLILRVLEKASV